VELGIETGLTRPCVVTQTCMGEAGSTCGYRSSHFGMFGSPNERKEPCLSFLYLNDSMGVTQQCWYLFSEERWCDMEHCSHKTYDDV